MKRKFSSREKVLMTVLAVLLIVCSYVLLVDQPVRNITAEAAVRKENAESTMMIETAKLAKMRKMQKALDELSDGAEADVPDYDNAKEVIRLLNKALSQAEHYDLNFQPVEFDGQIACRTIDMTFTCYGYDAAKDIVKVLYDSPYRCEITALSIVDEDREESDAAASIWTGKVTANVTVCFYEFAPEAAGEAEKAE